MSPKRAVHDPSTMDCLNGPRSLSDSVDPPASVFKWSVLMKQLILAALAVLSLGVGSAFAQSYSHEAPPNNRQAVVNRN